MNYYGANHFWYGKRCRNVSIPTNFITSLNVTKYLSNEKRGNLNISYKMVRYEDSDVLFFTEEFRLNTVTRTPFKILR